MNRLILAGVVLACVAGVAEGASRSQRVSITRDGMALRGGAAPAPAKTQVFCQANPDVIVSYVETITVGAAATIREDGAAAQVTVNVNVDAICPAGTSVLSLGYGALPSSTAVPGQDFTAFAPITVNFATLTQFGSATRSVTATIQPINDALDEGDENIDLGLVEGLFVSGGTADRVTPDGTVLLTLILDDDDDIDFSLGGITGLLNGALASSLDPVALAAIGPFAENCSTATQPEIIAQCEAILALADNAQVAALTTALRAISGEEISAQVTSAIDGNYNQGAQVSSRIAALRGGATGISLDDVAFNWNGVAVPLAARANAAGEADDFGGGLLDNRLGAFFNVTVLGGERDGDAFEVGFDFDGWSMLGGIDWRFTPEFTAGAALGYTKTSSDLDFDGGSLDSEGYSLFAYGNWSFSERGYVDFNLGALRNDYDQERTVDLSVLGGTFGLNTARGETSGDQESFGVGLGWDVQFGNWMYSPRGSVLRSRSRIDGFTEQDAGINDLIFADQEFDSMLWTFSQSISGTYAVSAGVIQPYFGLDISREQRGDAFMISPTLRVRPEIRSTPVFINGTDRTFARGEIGMTFVGARGIQWFASYSQIIGFENVSAWAARAGLRFEFD